MASLPHHRSLPEAILVWFLEVLGAVTAILFGVFGVMSWKVADEANQKSDIANSRSDTANLVALVALCAQLTAGDDASVSSFTWVTVPMVYLGQPRRTKNEAPLKQPLVALCNGIQAAAEPEISAIASSFFGNITPTTITSGSASATSTSASSTSSEFSPPPAASGDGGSSPNSEHIPVLGLGLGLGIGSVVLFISAMTVWAMVKKRRTPPEVPRKD